MLQVTTSVALHNNTKPSNKDSELTQLLTETSLNTKPYIMHFNSIVSTGKEGNHLLDKNYTRH